MAISNELTMAKFCVARGKDSRNLAKRPFLMKKKRVLPRKDFFINCESTRVTCYYLEIEKLELFTCCSRWLEFVRGIVILIIVYSYWCINPINRLCHANRSFSSFLSQSVFQITVHALFSFPRLRTSECTHFKIENLCSRWWN